MTMNNASVDKTKTQVPVKDERRDAIKEVHGYLHNAVYSAEPVEYNGKIEKKDGNEIKWGRIEFTIKLVPFSNGSGIYSKLFGDMSVEVGVGTEHFEQGQGGGGGKTEGNAIRIAYFVGPEHELKFRHTKMFESGMKAPMHELALAAGTKEESAAAKKVLFKATEIVRNALTDKHATEGATVDEFAEEEKLEYLCTRVQEWLNDYDLHQQE